MRGVQCSTGPGPDLTIKEVVERTPMWFTQIVPGAFPENLSDYKTSGQNLNNINNS